MTYLHHQQIFIQLPVGIFFIICACLNGSKGRTITQLILLVDILISRSRTCPQCRCKATDKNIHKIYLSIEENAEVTDVSTLQSKLDNLQFDIGLKENHIKKVNEKCSVMKVQNLGLR